MSGWMRIGDDEFAKFGKKKVRIEAAGEYYFIFVDERDQTSVQVSYDNLEVYWRIELKLKKGGDFKLCGISRPLPGILSDVHWYEFVLSPSIVITYWGDQAIFRSDRGIQIA